jgi:NTE family protein
MCNSYAQRKSVGVVLSGGGAKGVAHIEALKAIERAGIPIDYIAGTSMGAIIGGLYAIGYDTATLDSMVRTQNWNAMLADRVSRNNMSFGTKENEDRYVLSMSMDKHRRFTLPSGLLSGNKVYNLLYELTMGYHDSLSFDRLPIPFACVAYNMVDGKAVVMRSGSLPESIRASMSVPGAFKPVDKGDMVLVDGGVGNNFPVDVAKEMGADVIIGIDVTAPLHTKEELHSVADIFDQLTNFTAKEAYDRNMKMVDFYVRPDISGYDAASFSTEAIDTLLVRGKEAMQAKYDELLALKQRIGLPEDYRTAVRPRKEVNIPIPIGEIDFAGVEHFSERTLRRIVGIRESSIVTSEEIERAVARLQGTEGLTDVHYRLEGKSPYTLTFVATERSRNSVSFGFRFNSDEMAAVLLNVTFATRRMANSHFDITGRLGANPYVEAGYMMGNNTQRNFSLSYRFGYNDLSAYRGGEKTSNIDFNDHRVDLRFSNITLRNYKIDVGVRYNYYYFRSVLGSDALSRRYDPDSQGIITYYVRSHLESIDNRYFPTRGISFTVDYTLMTSDFITYKGGSPYSAIQLNFIAPISISRRVTIMPGLFGRVLIGNNFAYPSLNFMGGSVASRYMPQQIAFIGLNDMEVMQNTVLGARLDLRVRLWQKHYVSLRSNYAKQHNNFFNILTGEDIFGFGLQYSYNSFIGPIGFRVDYSNYDRKLGLYFNIGYYF